MERDRFYIVKEGTVQLESRFELEFVSKVPMREGMTEWKVVKEKRQGAVAQRGPGSMFGFEETALTASHLCKAGGVS
jgi:hypothetical protein